MFAGWLKTINKYKKVLLHLEEIQKERTDSAIWLEIQTLKDCMSNLYYTLYERIHHPHTKTSDLPNLVSYSKLALPQNNRLETYVNTQLPLTSKNKDLPKISYSNNKEESGLLEGVNTMAETTNNEIIYED